MLGQRIWEQEPLGSWKDISVHMRFERETRDPHGELKDEAV